MNESEEQGTVRDKQRTVHVVLPAFNEAANIGSVLRALEAAWKGTHTNFCALVVNDGSTDATAAIVRSYAGGFPVKLVEHSSNLGLGATLRTGLFHALDAADDEDIIVVMDADDTHTPGAISEMVRRIRTGLDVVIASRYCAGSVVVGVPPFRRFLSYSASLLFRAVHPIDGVKDFTCGYRAYRASVLRRAASVYRQEFVNQEGFQCMVDILLKLSRMSLRFGEVPLVLRYDQKGGKSKMKVWRTTRKTLVLLLKRRMGF